MGTVVGENLFIKDLRVIRLSPFDKKGDYKIGLHPGEHIISYHKSLDEFSEYFLIATFKEEHA